MENQVTEEREANAEAEARAKVSRPWFEKKLYWLLGFVAVTSFSIGSAVSDGDTSVSNSSKNQLNVSDTTLVNSASGVESSTETSIPMSTTPEETAGQENARKSAESYLRSQAFSRSGLIKQLEFEKFSLADANYAVDVVEVDWNEQAEKTAKSYLQSQAFSRQGLIDQLLFEGFTQAQAEYGVSTTGL
jgi:hypothetical protein